MIGLGARLGRFLKKAASGLDAINNYFRPDGISTYKRPDGSNYKRT